MQLFRNYTKIIPKDKWLLAGGSFLSHSNKIWLSNSQRNQCPHKQKREKTRDVLFFHARRGSCKTNWCAKAKRGPGCKPAVHACPPAGTSVSSPLSCSIPVPRPHAGLGRIPRDVDTGSRRSAPRAGWGGGHPHAVSLPLDPGGLCFQEQLFVKLRVICNMLHL